MALMRGGEIQCWPDRHDARRVDVVVRHVVVALNVVKMDRLRHAVMLVEGRASTARDSRTGWATVIPPHVEGNRFGLEV